MSRVCILVTKRSQSQLYSLYLIGRIREAGHIQTNEEIGYCALQAADRGGDIVT